MGQRVTMVDQIEPNGTDVLVRILLVTVEPDKKPFVQYHRTGIALENGPGVAAQMAFVNAHLAGMGWPPVSEADIGKISDKFEVAKARQRV